MKIAISGPNKFGWYLEINPEAKKIISEIAKVIAKTKHEIVLTPDKDSALAFLGREYLKNNGKKIYEVAPMDEEDVDDYLDLSLGEIISCSKWPFQPSEFNKQSDLMICLAYGGMVMAEIGCNKYYNPKKIYIIKELITSELPKEINDTLNVYYISYKDINSILK